ncbi:MAG: metallophosphoesterase [Paludibacter sp.]
MKRIQLFILFTIFCLFGVIKSANTFVRWGSTGNPLTGLTVTWKNTGTTDQIKWGLTTSYENGSFTPVKRTAYTGYFFDYQFPTMTAATTIHYQIYDSSTSTWSADLTYQTSSNDPASKFSFLVLGDSRTNMTVWQTVANLAKAKNSDFGLFSGDVTANSGTGTNWDTWFSSGTSLISQKLLYHCEGNHDSNANGNEAVYLTQFILPNNKQYYTFNYGNAVFIVLNSEVPTDATQLTWLKTTLAANVDKTWKVVMFHKPFYTIGTHAADMTSYKSTWWKVFDDNGVDIIFNGHDHMYERSKPINLNVNATAPVSTYGSGPTQGRCQIVCGGSGAPLYTGTITNMIDQYSSTYHFCKINVVGNTLTDSTFDSTGKLIDTFVLQKSATGISQPLQTFHQIDVIPNPNNGQFHLKYVSEQNGKVNIRVSDLNGKEVKKLIAEKSESEFNYNLSLKNLPKGLYSAEVSLNNQTDHALFIVK